MEAVELLPQRKKGEEDEPSPPRKCTFPLFFVHISLVSPLSFPLSYP